PAQPFGTGGVDAALTLDGLDDDGGGGVQARAAVLKEGTKPEEVRGLPVEVVVEGHRGDMVERDTRAATLHGVTGHGQGAQGHAVEAVGEVDDRLATGDLAGQLQRGLDGVVAGRAGELDLVVEAPRFEDDVLEGF